MNGKRLLFLLLSICLFETGCTLFVAKAVYDGGGLVRVYPAAFEESVAACVATLESLNIRIIDNTSSGIKTKIVAEWTDGTPVTVIVVMLDLRVTEVSVRSGVVGITDKKVCRMIHDGIAQNLGI